MTTPKYSIEITHTNLGVNKYTWDIYRQWKDYETERYLVASGYRFSRKAAVKTAQRQIKKLLKKDGIKFQPQHNWYRFLPEFFRGLQW